MNIVELRKKTTKELKENLSLLYRKKLKLLLDKTSGAEFSKNHTIKNVRKNIARVLTLITELEKKKV